jgi:Fur family zinc uptake transcriptional regulator
MMLQSETAPSAIISPTHDHAGCREKAIHTAEQLCNQRGVRFTPIRREVLELIWESHRAVKAYDLLDRIKPKAGTAKPATVYRVLDFLLAQGLIHKVESLNAFIGCSFSDRRHEQLLLTCVQCHEVEERPGERVMEAIAKELERAAFTLQSKAIEIHGICARCGSYQTTD